MTEDALAGDTTLTVDVDLDSTNAGWNAGDEIVLTGSYFKKDEATREEKLTIVSISGDVITIDSDPGTAGNQGLEYDHVRADSSFRLHVANLTRNITLKSDDTSETYHRGHVMFKDADVAVEHVAFVGLGRTDKKIPLDDTIVETDDGQPAEDIDDYTGEVSAPDPEDVDNPRGRYSVHFHKNGVQPSASTPPSLVHDSVVVDTPGWGFVSHSSHVDFEGNVAYDFDGAGFVTEAGDELGNFTENLAIRGNGLEVSHENKYRLARIVFNDIDRPQPLSDFGFLGEGFWFQGPAIRAVDNVANGCQGAGMIWFTAGAPDISYIDSSDDRNDYSGFPDSAMSDTYGSFSDYSSFEGRHWDHATDQLVIADLPILECDGFEGYANFLGFKLRFQNMDSIAWYQEANFDYDGDIVPISGGDKYDAVRMREEVSNLTLWNNEQGFRARYSTKTDFEDVTVVNRLRYDDTGRSAGMEMHAVVDDTTLTDLTIDGYTIAGWEDSDANDPADLTYYGTRSYSNYASYDTAITPFSNCPLVGTVTATVQGSDEIDLSWSHETDHKRYLVRYWLDGEDRVEFQGTSKSLSSPQVMTLSGLEADSTYRFQVIAGCVNSPSQAWRPLTPGSATTDP